MLLSVAWRDGEEASLFARATANFPEREWEEDGDAGRAGRGSCGWEIPVGLLGAGSPEKDGDEASWACGFPEPSPAEPGPVDGCHPGVIAATGQSNGILFIRLNFFCFRIQKHFLQPFSVLWLLSSYEGKHR